MADTFYQTSTGADVCERVNYADGRYKLVWLMDPEHLGHIAHDRIPDLIWGDMPADYGDGETGPASEYTQEEFRDIIVAGASEQDYSKL